MNWTNRAVAFWKRKNLYLKSNAEEMEQSNGNLAFILLIMGCITFVPFIALSFFLDSYRHLTMPYIVELLILLVFLLSFRKLKKHIPAAYLIYAAYGSLVGYSIYTSAFVTPDYTSVIILFFLFQIPVVTIDKSWRVNLVVLAYSAIYMITAIPFKEPRLVSDEILNCLLFSLLGIGLGEALRYTRLENFELKRQAHLHEKIDYLTELDNRKSLFEDLKKIESESAQQSIGILMIDADHFKQYNDTYGHQAGDWCLKKLGSCFRGFGTEHGIRFYRYGGEEFVGVVCGYSAEELISICKNLNQAVLELKIPHRFSETSFVTVSIGIASTIGVWNPDEAQHLLSQADTALYQAKMRGRNQTALFEKGMVLPTS